MTVKHGPPVVGDLIKNLQINHFDQAGRVKKVVSHMVTAANKGDIETFLRRDNELRGISSAAWLLTWSVGAERARGLNPGTATFKNNWFTQIASHFGGLSKHKFVERTHLVRLLDPNNKTPLASVEKMSIKNFGISPQLIKKDMDLGLIKFTDDKTAIEGGAPP